MSARTRPRSAPAPPPRKAPSSSPSTPETVDPRWLLWAGLVAVLVAALCAYTTLCITFWNTQWQLVLQPSRFVERTPAALPLPFEEVRFSPGPDGQPQLQGWWIPATNPAAPVALLLPSGTGNKGDALPLVRTLHIAGLQVFVFDYRGFGTSSGAHPSQNTMQEDAEAAVSYLENFRHVPDSATVPVSEGLSASLAVGLAANHRQLPAVVLFSPDGDFGPRAKEAGRSRMVPFSWLFHEQFPLAGPLAQLRTPKLIVAPGQSAAGAFARQAADPKMTVELPKGDDAALEASLRRFLDTYVPRPPQELRPVPARTR